MPHPKRVKRVSGKTFHLEDDNLTLVEASSLQKHLKKTEDKRAIKNHTSNGYEVWWSK